MTFFRDQEEALALTYPAWGSLLPPGDLCTSLTIFDEATEKGADRVARTFARSGKWPSMSMEVGAMIRMRLVWAAEYLGGLEYAHRILGLVSFGAELEREPLVRLLLVQAWGEAGFAPTVEMLEHLRLPCIGAGGLQASDGSHPEMN